MKHESCRVVKCIFRIISLIKIQEGNKFKNNKNAGCQNKIMNSP